VRGFSIVCLLVLRGWVESVQPKHDPPEWLRRLKPRDLFRIYKEYGRSRIKIENLKCGLLDYPSGQNIPTWDTICHGRLGQMPAHLKDGTIFTATKGESDLYRWQREQGMELTQCSARYQGGQRKNCDC